MHLCAFFPGRRAVQHQRASPTRALPSFSLSNSLLRTLFQARLFCLAVALSLPHTPGVRFPAGPGSLVLACVLALMLSLLSVRARPVSLFSSLARSLSCAHNFSLSLSLPLALPPPGSLPCFLEPPSSYLCSHCFMFALWRLMLSINAEQYGINKAKQNLIFGRPRWTSQALTQAATNVFLMMNSETSSSDKNAQTFI